MEAIVTIDRAIQQIPEKSCKSCEYPNPCLKEHEMEIVSDGYCARSIYRNSLSEPIPPPSRYGKTRRAVDMIGLTAATSPSYPPIATGLNLCAPPSGAPELP